MHTLNVLELVRDERVRQEALKAAGKFRWTCADTTFQEEPGVRGSPIVSIGNPEKLAVLSEEFGEVAREVVEALIYPSRYDAEKLRDELIQVAAVAVAWAESLVP